MKGLGVRKAIAGTFSNFNISIVVAEFDVKREILKFKYYRIEESMFRFVWINRMPLYEIEVGNTFVATNETIFVKYNKTVKSRTLK